MIHSRIFFADSQGCCCLFHNRLVLYSTSRPGEARRASRAAVSIPFSSLLLSTYFVRSRVYWVTIDHVLRGGKGGGGNDVCAKGFSLSGFKLCIL